MCGSKHSEESKRTSMFQTVTKGVIVMSLMERTVLDTKETVAFEPVIIHSVFSASSRWFTPCHQRTA